MDMCLRGSSSMIFDRRWRLGRLFVLSFPCSRPSHQRSKVKFSGCVQCHAGSALPCVFGRELGSINESSASKSKQVLASACFIFLLLVGQHGAA
mmetsp:Transcript_51567/g.138385  ORF Transcript_51567/g.138385 Transcript_51567/m.138385 type:complete len:94 (+) Transcript_51567:1044-1325(+)